MDNALITINEEPLITSGTDAIETENATKYLVIHLDKHLTFDTHINIITKKVNQKTRLLWKMRNFITIDLAKYLYSTIIQPVFNYCNFIYDGTLKMNEQKLHVCQNSALRAVRNCHLDYLPNRLRTELGVDSLELLCKKIDPENGLSWSQ